MPLFGKHCALVDELPKKARAGQSGTNASSLWEMTNDGARLRITHRKGAELLQELRGNGSIHAHDGERQLALTCHAIGPVGTTSEREKHGIKDEAMSINKPF